MAGFWKCWQQVDGASSRFRPLIVHSAYRSPEHNCAVGGVGRSKHMEGAAFDIAMANRDPVAFEGEADQATVRWTVAPPNARAVGFLGFGFYPRSGFHPCRPRPGTPVRRAIPGPGDGICSRGAARARGAG